MIAFRWRQKCGTRTPTYTLFVTVGVYVVEFQYHNTTINFVQGESETTLASSTANKWFLDSFAKLHKCESNLLNEQFNKEFKIYCGLENALKALFRQ